MTSFSVVIPTHNRAHLLPSAVTSALRQTHPPEEVVIVDDGSTDGTEEVCRDFPAGVRYIRQNNGGVSSARNRGARQARGEYIAFLDSDDLWEKNKLEVQAAALLKNSGAGWSISNANLVDTNGRRKSGVRGFDAGFPVFQTRRLEAAEFFRRSLKLREVNYSRQSHRVFTGDAFELLFYGNFVLPSSLVVSRDLFLELGGFDESLRLAEETELSLRLAAVADVVIAMTPLVNWRVGDHDSLISSDNTVKLIRNAWKSLDRAAGLREELSEDVHRAYALGREDLCYRLAYARLSNLDRWAARATIAGGRDRGIRLTPRAAAVYLASLLPVPVLRGLHGLKRGLRTWTPPELSPRALPPKLKPFRRPKRKRGGARLRSVRETLSP